MIDFFGNIIGLEIINFFQGLGFSLSILFIIGIFLGLFGLYSVSSDVDDSFDKHFFTQKHTQTSVSLNQQRWQSIKQLFSSPDPISWRMAIIDADAMLEEMISDMGYRGDTFGEKLKDMHRDNIPWLQAAWDVHLLRNKLAHEGSRYPLNERESYRAYKIYENILSGSGYLA